MAVALYRLTEGCRDRGFKDQVTRAALSIPSNIAEGYERGSSREFARFLKIAKGSAGELRTQLYVGIELGILDRAPAQDLVNEAIELSKMLQGLVKRYSV